MSKNTLTKEIIRELEKLNDTIDRKIIKGLSYKTEAKRHRELTETLHRIRAESEDELLAHAAHRSGRRGKSPVRRELAGGVVRRLFGFSLAV